MSEIMPYGSSPRVRGKLGRGRVRGFVHRIIPARAGQTNWHEYSSLSYSDHPRACGANMPSSTVCKESCGSSPRVRGKHLFKIPQRYRNRIIPARAGQTVTQIDGDGGTADHPRACGANFPGPPWDNVSSGSSPRVRGKQFQALQIHVIRRIIPARAGQTARCAQVFHALPDHPRACGANPCRAVTVVFSAGSSPRVRGKQSDFMRKLLSAGPSIIGFAQWLQSSCYCSCFQSSAKTPISRGTTPTSLFLGFQNSITLLLLT